MFSNKYRNRLVLLMLLSIGANAWGTHNYQKTRIPNDAALMSSSPFHYITLDNVLRISNLSEDVWSNDYLNVAWKGWKYEKSISVRGCLEQGWLDPTKQSFVNVEKCGDWVFLDTFIVFDGPKNLERELNAAFTKLGTELLKYKVGMDDDMIVYRIVQGAKTYQIKVNWQMKYLFVMVVE